MIDEQTLDELRGIEVQQCIFEAIRRCGEEADFHEIMDLAERLWRRDDPDA